MLDKFLFYQRLALIKILFVYSVNTKIKITYCKVNRYRCLYLLSPWVFNCTYLRMELLIVTIFALTRCCKLFENDMEKSLFPRLILQSVHNVATLKHYKHVLTCTNYFLNLIFLIQQFFYCKVRYQRENNKGKHSRYGFINTCKLFADVPLITKMIAINRWGFPRYLESDSLLLL